MKAIFPVYLGFLYFFGLIVYPQWYFPDSSPCLRYSLAFAFLILTLGAFLLAKYLVNQPGVMESKGSGRIYRDYKYELIVGLFCLITHLPFMRLPILPLGDGHMHAGLPALALAKLNSLCVSKVGISFRVLFFLCSGTVLLLLLKWRGQLLRFLSSTKGFTLILLSGVAYVMVLSRFPVLEKFGKLEHLFRYPVLGKSLFFCSYATFGIHEWVGRAMQIAFLFVGAFYFSRLLELLSNREIARVGYLIFLMFPPFWDLAHQNFLTAGVLFFSAASMYYLVRYLRQGRPFDVYVAMTIMATGIMYKRPIIALIPISFLTIILWCIFRRRFSFRELKVVFLSFFFPVGLAVSDLLSYSHLRSLYPYYAKSVNLQYLFSPSRLIGNIRLVPFATGWVITAFAILGFLLSCKYRRKLALLFSLWFTTYWVLNSATTGHWVVRVSLIGYLPIAGFLSVAFGSIGKRFLNKRYQLAMALLFVGFTFLNMHIGPGEAISLPKIKKVFLPYDELFKFVKDNKLHNHRIYAPMLCEPSHFYMAKHGLSDEDFLFRKKWDTSYGGFGDFLRVEDFSYLVVPQGPQVEGVIEAYIDKALIEEMLSGRAEYAVPYKLFSYGENTLTLFKIPS